MSPATPTRPGRPRSARVDQAILAATIEALVADGYDGLTLSGVAERAGVGRPAIYRRYRSRATLAAAAVLSLSAGPDVHLPEHPRAALRALLGAAASALASEGSTTILGSMLSYERRDPELMEAFREAVFEPRFRIVRQVLDQAMARGEARPDLDAEVVIDLLFGALMASAFKGAVIDDSYLDRVIDSAWFVIRKDRK